MKKLLLLLPLISVGCSQNDGPSAPVEKKTTQNLNRSEEEILRIAEAASLLKGNEGRSERVAVDKTSIKPISKKYGRSENADTLIYAVNFKDDNGFVLISAKEGVTPIIGIADEGAFDNAQTYSNKNFQFFIDNALDYVKSSSDAASIQGVSSTIAYDTIKEYTRYPERLKTKWGPDWPENMYCPNGIAGCGPVALAQMLAYYEDTKEIELTFSERDKDIQTLNWKEIKRHESTDPQCHQSRSDYYHQICTADEETHKVIGRFIRQLGELSDTYYDPTGTSTSMHKSYEVAQSLMPNRTIYLLLNGSEILYDMKFNNSIGYIQGNGKYSIHSWNIDGAMIIKYQLYNRSNFVYTLNEEEYIHHNWGWYGNSNGYYAVGIFDPDLRYTDDDPVWPNRGDSRDYYQKVKYFVVDQ